MPKKETCKLLCQKGTCLKKVCLKGTIPQSVMPQRDHAPENQALLLHNCFSIKDQHLTKIWRIWLKIEAASTFTSSQLNWVWRAQFLNYKLQILGKFIFFQDVQMIVKSVLDIFNGTKVTKNPKACGSILEQSLVRGSF